MRLRPVPGLVCLPVLILTLSANAQEVPPQMRSIVEKTQSFGLGKYPISFWSYTNLNEHLRYMDEAEVDEWADAGFTVPQSPSYDPTKPEQVAHMRQMLDWAQERGIKLILCDPRGYAKVGPDGHAAPDYADGVRAAVAQFGDHPALFGFHVGDEPGRDAKHAFAECARIQSEIAPHLHPFGNHLPWWPGAESVVGNTSWPEYLDEFCAAAPGVLLSYDFYGQMAGNVAGYYENLRLYREASVRNGVPFWNTVLSVGHFRYRCPNYDDIRWQFNTTVCAGANGILWFFYYMRQPHDNYRLSPVDEHWERTQTYYDIRRVQKSFHRFYGDLFTRLVSTGVHFTPEAIGNGQAFTPNGLVSAVKPDKEGHPLLLGYFADLQGQRYVMLVNNSTTESVNAALTFPGEDVKVFSWDWSGREREGGAYCAGATERTPEGLTIRHWLAPGQEAVYRVQSARAAAEPLFAGCEP